MLTPDVQPGDEVFAELRDVQFETPGSKLHQLASAHNAMLEAASYAAELQKEQSQRVERALLVALIVAYGRPFKDAEHPLKGEERRPQLEEHRALEVDAELHETMIRLRDQHIVHSDLSPGTSNLLVLIVGENGRLSLSAAKLLKADRVQYRRMEALCRRLAEGIETEINAAFEELGPIRAKLSPGQYRLENDGLSVKLIRIHR